MSAWEAEVEKELESKQFRLGNPGGRGEPTGREKALSSRGAPGAQAAVDAQKACVTHLGMAGQKEGRLVFIQWLRSSWLRVTPGGVNTAALSTGRGRVVFLASEKPVTPGARDL